MLAGRNAGNRIRFSSRTTTIQQEIKKNKFLPEFCGCPSKALPALLQLGMRKALKSKLLFRKDKPIRSAL